MSVRRLLGIKKIPHGIIKPFRNAEEPNSPEEVLWREVAARMILDAMGYTGMTGEPDKHDEVVKEARRWFRGIPYPESPVAVFDNAALIGYLPEVKAEVLKWSVQYLTEDIYDD